MAENQTQSGTRGSVLIVNAADVLGVSRRTVYYHIQAGRLLTIRTRGGSQRVLWSSIESFLREARGLPQLRPAEPTPRILASDS